MYFYLLTKFSMFTLHWFQWLSICLSQRSEFDAHGYYNSCTMKSCCFAGADDELVVSGSDDFSVYAWRLDAPGKRGVCGPDHKIVKRAEVVLKGHR